MKPKFDELSDVYDGPDWMVRILAFFLSDVALFTLFALGLFSVTVACAFLCNMLGIVGG